MQPSANFLLMVLSIATTGICWGIYGPILHLGQHSMGGGRLRTFICVGIAYFLVAIVVPLVFMFVTRWEMAEEYHSNTKGIVWSLLGGALGAVGALGIIFAFTYSPFSKPVTPMIVMPLVFGLAPVCNTFFQLYLNRDKGLAAPNPIFYAGLILVVAGAVTVLIFAPKADPKKAHAHKQREQERKAEVATMTSSSNVVANMKLQEELEKAEEAENAESHKS